MSAIGDLVVNLVTKTQQFTSPLTGAIGHMSGFVSRITSMTGTLGQLTAGLSVAGALGWGVSLTAEAEQAKIAFTTMLGSATQAKTLLGELSRFAVSTPYESPEVISAGKQLLAYGISAEKIGPTLRKLGDIASGVGAPLGDIAYLFGTSAVQGRLFAKDINQFTNRGIPIIDALAKTMGVAKTSVMGLVEAGQVGFPQLSGAIDHLSGTGSRFGGLMEKQSRSLTGLWSTMKDNLGITLRKITEQLLEAFDMKGILESTGIALSTIQGYLEANRSVLSRIGAAVAFAARALGLMGAAALAYAIYQRAATAAAIVFQAVLNPASMVRVGIALVAAGVAVYAMDQGFRRMAVDVASTKEQLAGVTVQTNVAAAAADRLHSRFTTLPAAIPSMIGELKKLRSIEDLQAFTPDQMAKFLKKPELNPGELFPEANEKAQQVREINEELRVLTDLVNRPGVAVEGPAKKIQEMTDQLGRLSGATAAIAAAQEQLDTARYGERSVQREKLFDAGATLGQVRELDALLAKLDEVKSKQDSLRQAMELRGRGESMMTALKDEIDLLSGAATRADIELRKLQREGFEQDQIDQIAKLQQERDALEANKAGPESRNPNFAAALTKGSAEAISAVNRAAFGNPNSSHQKKMESLNSKQLACQEKLLNAFEHQPEVEEKVCDF